MPEVGPNTIPLGTDNDGRAVTVELESLRKHVAVFAGSGSGKTVLLRRIIEECALRGVSTIVLDPNNDLARLGDAWPVEPDGWWPGDDARSREYLAGSEVVVWTPGVSKGRPLTLEPFPDFAAVRDDRDELRLAVDTAVASLAPRARIDGESHVKDGRRAVLRETLMYFARHGGGDLDRLIELLADPPDDVLDLPSAGKHASYVASALSYARSNDPLFDGEGTVFDPNRLLTPTDGFRARVSVINLAGVPDENRPAFINRLQMALFSWIKRNPARDKPLSGLFVMDEAQTFIPSGKTTPCTESTRNLASQARKYGLGLVYATQAPRGIDNRITGNAATHVYGRVTVPAQMAAVQDMARARGGEPPKVAVLTAGQFYSSLEGQPMTRMTVPMCLSHHGAPLEDTEIVERARTRQ
ncbi:ATP-binding protein [Stackebrandtia soli]|uniref:ATP-binding protein n=1 Tax=Stackebrandtia soli TaxID=1892856 RepID=UPI0039E78C0A